MAIVKNVELWWVKCDAKRPIKNQDAGKPDYWEIQLRTTDKKLALEWAKENVKFKPLKRTLRDEEGNPILDDMGEEQSELVLSDEGKPYFAVKVRRKVRKNEEDNIELDNNGEPKIVKFVGGNLQKIDPNTVGNKSVGNVNLYQYPYSFKQNGKTVEGIANTLISVQVTKLHKYESKSSEGFEMTDMEVIDGSGNVSRATESADHDDNDIDDDIPF